MELPLDPEGKGLAAGAVTRLALWCRAGMPVRVGLFFFLILYYVSFTYYALVPCSAARHARIASALFLHAHARRGRGDGLPAM